MLIIFITELYLIQLNLHQFAHFARLKEDSLPLHPLLDDVEGVGECLCYDRTCCSDSEVHCGGAPECGIIEYDFLLQYGKEEESRSVIEGDTYHAHPRSCVEGPHSLLPEDCGESVEDVLIRESISLHCHSRTHEVQGVGYGLCHDSCNRTADEEAHLPREGFIIYVIYVFLLY